MPLRLMLLAVLLLCFCSSSAFPQDIYHLPHNLLRSAAADFRLRDYSSARTKVLKAPESGEQLFMAGIAAYKLGQWDEAVARLDKSVKEFPLLADFSLYYQADALNRLNRCSESAELLQKLLKSGIDSPTTRAARLLYAEVLFNRGDFTGSRAAYQDFIEKYPSGSDSITAVYQSALCDEALGSKIRAAQEFRSIWLSYPASDIAEKAAENLQRLDREGTKVSDYSADELLKRGSTLYTLNRFTDAVATLSAIPRSGLADDLAAKISFKTGQALFRARKYREAEQTFNQLRSSELKPTLAAEVRYWLARAREKTGDDEGAFAVYLKIAEVSPAGELADNALLQAAYIRKFQGRYPEAFTLLTRLLDTYPHSPLRERATWEAAWNCYLRKDFNTAAVYFKAITTSAEYREKAIYWQARALEESGEKELATSLFRQLLDEFPHSYYALYYKKLNNIRALRAVSLTTDLNSLFPMPSGYDRTKALISMGLLDEARKELAVVKKKDASKQRNESRLSRLYLEMDDYPAVMALMRQETPRTIESGNLQLWAASYPQPFSEAVAARASETKLSTETVYSIIRAESRFSPVVKSPAGAIGLMQLMPATAREFLGSNSRSSVTSLLTQPDLNIKLGTRHFRGLLERFNGNLVSAIAAYNAGATPVDRWRRNIPSRNEDEFIENIPYHETREYVKKVLAGIEMYRLLYDQSPAAAPAAAAESTPLTTPPPVQQSPQENRTTTSSQLEQTVSVR